MDPKSVEADRGVAWFSCGWQIFAKNPGMWVVVGILVIAFVLVLGSVPFGGFVLTLFGPALGGGLLYGAAQVKAGRPLELNYLLQGFRDQTKFTPLLVLGAVILAAGLLSLLIAVVFIGGVLMTGASDDAALAIMRLGAAGLVALLLIFTVQMVATALVCFAVPLVMFAGVPAGAAMQSSLRACLRNVLSLFVFSLIYLVVAIVATLPFGLGWLVLLPWSVAMLYCSYEDIYRAA